MPKPADHKKISLVTFITAILGLLSLWPILQYPWYVVIVRNIGESVYLSWIRDSNFHILGANGPVFITYASLLIGGILFVTSRYRESRLIRFVFSVILISKAYFVLIDFFSLFKHHLRATELTWIVIHILLNTGWAVLSWWILKAFKTEKQPAVEYVEYGETTTELLINDSAWQRLLHLVVDTVLCILIFSFTLYVLADIEALRSPLERIASAIGERLTMTIILGFFRLIYYIFFESLLGATPAKLLTESRVLTRGGEEPKFNTVMVRTFSRFIPFEAFSFFGSSGWHDRFSDTVVVREKRTGVKGAAYFFLIPLFFGLNILGNFGSEQYQRHLRRKALEKDADFLTEKLSEADTNSVFLLKKLSPYSYSVDVKVYLKVDKVNPASITFSKIISINGYDEASEKSIEDQYEGSKDSLEHYTYSKEALEKAIRAGQGMPGDTIGVKIGDIEYGIEKIDSYFMPNLQLQYAQNGGGPEGIRADLSNTGWPADINEIKVVEGDARVTAVLPVHLKQYKYKGAGAGFVLTGTRKSGQSFKINLLLSDTLNRRHTYQLEGNGDELALKRLK